MSDSISSLLTRNLHDVFGENDPARRRAAIDEIFTEDCVFHEPRGVYRGRDEIERVAGAIKATGNAPRLSISADCPARGIGQWWAGPVGLGSSWRGASVRRD
jgi:hypothetical protein